MKIESDKTTSLVNDLGDIFFRPWLAMIAWGAFIHMSHVNLPAFSYWEFFMLNCVTCILNVSRITKWVVKEKEEQK